MDTGRIEYYKVGINDLYISEEENRIIVELIGVDLTHVHRFLSQIANMPEFQIKEADLPVTLTIQPIYMKFPSMFSCQLCSGISLI